MLDGYKLEMDSVLIDKGLTVEEAWKHFGGTKLVDGRKYSPREFFEEAKAQDYASIDCIMGNNFPEVLGAAYDKDFFGESITKGRPDIGAAEYSMSEPENRIKLCWKVFLFREPRKKQNIQKESFLNRKEWR